METNETPCPNCGGTLYARGLFYLDQIPFTKEAYTPTDGQIEEADDNLEIYCTACDFTQDMDEYVQAKSEEK